ncbi:thiopeptide-type bacteriocin biosynthesis protein [Streptomyces sp. KR80]|uniref:thiopeptide-type bacteriocin biosynthesis protein n=1 Tax=Streptomyces sp. KR80 TaxID=3457426 RepID=UPI003FD32515
MRDWLYYRLFPQPAETNAPPAHDTKTRDGTPGADPLGPPLSRLVPPLVKRLRAADPPGSWFFIRYADRTGAHLRLRLRSTPEVLDWLERSLLAASARRGLPAMLDYYEPEAHKYPGLRGVERAERVFHASSDFVLDLLGGAGSVGAATRVPLAVLHLRQVIALVPPPARASFLTSYWRYWTSGLQPDRRAHLAAWADGSGSRTLQAAARIRLPDRARTGWQRYLDLLRDVAVERRLTDEAPRDHLLLHHAHLTHNRLGIPMAAEAAAARTLRTAQGTDGEFPVPLHVKEATGR